ncbi:MAG: tetraacyldisaccharide 4'-kinase [Lentisphaerae bacterium]|nr:tetraacyldisaccharide 4'-kinase [Lentisphaerota bacterium]
MPRQYGRERLEKYLIALIKGPEAGVLRTRSERALLRFLKAMSRLYRSVVLMRLYLYRVGIFRHDNLGCQVISIGNLTVGGTGKTPVVEIFARELQRQGRKVAILSRGYKKVEPGLLRRLLGLVTLESMRRPPRLVSDGNQLMLDSAMSGDEPYMLASNLPKVAVLVDKDRVKSGRYAIGKLGCDTLILDDGFQYLALKHWVEVVLVDKTDPFGNEHVLPRGILREPVSNIARANYIFITKSDGRTAGPLRQRLREMNPMAEIIECRHTARYLQNIYTAERRELGFLAGRRVFVVSGIADPRGFEREVGRRCGQVIEKRRFADHHRFSQQEILNIVNDAASSGADAIITTEKDAVRFPKLERCDVPVFFLRVDIEILSGSEDFRHCIGRICFRGEDEMLPAAGPVSLETAVAE